MAKTRSYDDYVKIFQEFKCKLLTTKEEYETSVLNLRYKKFKIEYTCKHIQDNVYFHSFICRNTYKTCKLCREKPIFTNDDLDIEFTSILLVEKLLKDSFSIIRCVESCKTDLLIKPITCKTDNWLPLQVKATTKPVYNQYKFFIDKGYTIQSLLCVCNDEERFWGFEKVPSVKRINIGISKKHKYIESEIKKEDLSAKLLKFYESSKKYTEKEINIPGTPESLMEYEYAIKRKAAITSLTFEEPERNQLSHDFLVNNYKVQEKTNNLYQLNKYTFKLQKRNGVINKIRKYINYELHDNKFYWLNLYKTDIFFVIPAIKLFERGFLQMEGFTTSRKSNLIIDPTKIAWYNEYKFNYRESDQAKLKAMFYS
jgi:hypothetical protein